MEILLSRVVWIEAKFQKIKEVRKEAVRKEDWLQKLVEKEKSMIDKPIKSVNMCKSLFGIGYCEHVYKGKGVILERQFFFFFFFEAFKCQLY